MVCAVALAACSPPAGRAAGPLRVVATTSTLASLAQGAIGVTLTVRSLVPVGVSPEDYQPTPADITALHDADVLVENGAGLEGWLDATVHNAANPGLRIVVCTDGLPVRNGNPHMWMDPEFARAYVRAIAAEVERADPSRAGSYRVAAAAYDRDLAALTRRTQRKIDTLPPNRRTILVFHDALYYYARRFGLHELGAIEPAAGAEPNPEHLAELVTLARQSHVPAIFAEHEYSAKLAQTVADSGGINRIAYTYDDSLGTQPNVATYIGMIDTDTDTIVEALR